MTGRAQEIIAFLFAQDREKVWDLKEHREKRGIDSNAYYWVLCANLAQKLRISTARLHNIMLRRVSSPFLLGGKAAMQAVPDTDEAEEQVLESDMYHLRPTSGVIVGRDGQVYRWYVMLKGSSSFNSAEMQALIDQMVAECKAQGIETATPDELAQMVAMWETRHGKAQADKGNGNTRENKKGS